MLFVCFIYENTGTLFSSMKKRIICSKNTVSAPFLDFSYDLQAWIQNVTIGIVIKIHASIWKF